MLRKYKCLILIAFLFIGTGLKARIPMDGSNSLIFGGIPVSFDLYADRRIADFVHSPLEFSQTTIPYQDSLLLSFDSEYMTFTMSFESLTGFKASGYSVNAKLLVKQDFLLHDLYIKLNFPGSLPINTFKGIKAIETRDKSFEYTLQPYTDMAMEYIRGDNSIWILGSNQALCHGIEGISTDRISLYDYKQHFYRKYRPNLNRTDLDRNTMPLYNGDTRDFGFVIFTQKPYLVEINRWPGTKQAALTIINDADTESQNSLLAVYMGSNNPTNPKYGTEGFIANNIRVSNTIFGQNYPALKPVWDTIKAAGSTIGYHTYTDLADPPGANATALLSDLVEYNIRTWIDHSVPGNPEDMAYNGLDPTSANFIGDVIEASNIMYVWAGDTPPTNPFNAFDDPGRMPHRVYELSSVQKPLWFFGRTRMEAWEYLTGWDMVAMKYLMTADNLDKLIRDRGLCIGYTHFSFSNNSTRNSFYQIMPSGDWEVRPDVNDMLVMLDHYQTHEGLWIEPIETIFDRLLATEAVKIVEVEDNILNGLDRITLQNFSDQDIENLRFSCQGEFYELPLMMAGSTFSFFKQHTNFDPKHAAHYTLSFKDGILKLKPLGRSLSAPMQVQIYNLRGQRVLNSTIDSYQNDIQIPFSQKGPGVYVARIKEQNYPTIIKKFSVFR